MQNEKCAIISIIGRPNAGKSTFLNAIAGQKLSIVTPKVQTTRNLVRAIANHDEMQLIFIDTPGIFQPNRKLEKSMVKTAWSSLDEGIDYIMHIFDGKIGVSKEDEQIINIIKNKNITLTAIINKADLLSDEELIILTDKIYKIGIYKEIFIISAQEKTKLNNIIDFFAKNLSFSPWLYPENEVTTTPKSLLAAEITREKLFLKLQKELPYNLTVETETFDQKGKTITINQVIYVNKASHKKIIIGNKGALIKIIGQDSRKELELIFAKKVNLFLFVKVRENWMDNKDIYNYLGMQQP